MSKFLTIVEVSDRIKRSAPCILGYIQRGLLPAEKGVDGKWYISAAAVDKFQTPRQRAMQLCNTASPAMDPEELEKLIDARVDAKLAGILESLSADRARTDKHHEVLRKLIDAVNALRAAQAEAEAA